MPSQNVMSLAVGRFAGKQAGVPPENIGRLSIISYFVGNPVLAIVAARSMAPKDGVKPEPAASAVDEAKAAVDAAKVAAAAAGASEANAKASADAAKASADEAKAAAAKASGGTTKS